MKAHFASMADYNRWANARLYDDAEGLSPKLHTRDVGLYFGSLLDTLFHILRTDRAWAFLLMGGDLAKLAPAEPPADLQSLRVMRQQQDNLLVAWIEGLDEAWLDQPYSFTSGLGDYAGQTFHGTHGDILSHLFNHQTHHRGQAHAALTILGLKEPKGLDILVKGYFDA